MVSHSIFIAEQGRDGLGRGKTRLADSQQDRRPQGGMTGPTKPTQWLAPGSGMVVVAETMGSLH